MKRKLSWLLAILISPWVLISCGDSKGGEQKKAPAAVPVNTYIVKTESVTGIDEYPGTVVPLNEVELRPQVAGYITNIFVKDGQKVTKDQPLYEIDRRKYQAAYQQAQANVQSAKANLQRVQKDVERYERLLEREAIAKQQVDYARADLQTAKSNVAAAQAQLSSAATDLAYSLIKAPFSGTVGISQVRVGAQVSPGQPLLNTISSDDPVAVDFVINEQEIPRFNKLLNKPQSDTLFRLRLADGSIYPHPGKMVTIDRAVGRQTGTINIRLNYPNPDRQLIAGMTANIQVLNQDLGNQLVIPYKAVTEQMSEYFAYVVQADSVVQQRLTLGSKIKDLVVIREGLKAGDKIVVDGIQKLRHGAKVQEGNALQPQDAAKK